MFDHTLFMSPCKNPQNIHPSYTPALLNPSVRGRSLLFPGGYFLSDGLCQQTFSPFPKEDEVFRLLFPGLVVFEVTYSYNWARQKSFFVFPKTRSKEIRSYTRRFLTTPPVFSHYGLPKLLGKLARKKGKDLTGEFVAPLGYRNPPNELPCRGRNHLKSF